MRRSYIACTLSEWLNTMIFTFRMSKWYSYPVEPFGLENMPIDFVNLPPSPGTSPVDATYKIMVVRNTQSIAKHWGFGGHCTLAFEKLFKTAKKLGR